MALHRGRDFIDRSAACDRRLVHRVVRGKAGQGATGPSLQLNNIGKLPHGPRHPLQAAAREGDRLELRGAGGGTCKHLAGRLLHLRLVGMPPHGRDDRLHSHVRLVDQASSTAAGRQAPQCAAGGHLHGGVTRMLQHELGGKGGCPGCGIPGARVARPGSNIGKHPADGRCKVHLLGLAFLGEIVLNGNGGYVEVQHPVGFALILEHPHDHRIEHNSAMESVFTEGVQGAQLARGLHPRPPHQGTRAAVGLAVGRHQLGLPARGARGHGGRRASGPRPGAHEAPQLREGADGHDAELELQKPLVLHVLDPQRWLFIERPHQPLGQPPHVWVAAHPGLAHKIRLVHLHAVLQGQHVLHHRAHGPQRAGLLGPRDVFGRRAQPRRRFQPHGGPGRPRQRVSAVRWTEPMP
mmetsp:Transcript_81786/g.243941  ORF Transcript_81786/g.243941 Transcript_81786/m.243941 type:complete len:408 (+) Transcript_81786:610-1833(+)